MKSLIKLTLIFLMALLVATHTVACIRINGGEGKEPTLTINGVVFPLENHGLRGNGVLITKTIASPEFDRVVVSRGIELFLRQGIDQITVEADENVMPYGVITCEEGELAISIDPKIKRLSDFTMRVYIPLRENLQEVKATSGAEVLIDSTPFEITHPFRVDLSSAAEFEGAIAAPELHVEASSGAEAKGHWVADQLEVYAYSAAEVVAQLRCGSVRIEASSGAEVEANGEADSVRMEASSGASIEAERLQCRVADADASSGASVELFCVEQLQANASSGGEVEYDGPCSVKMTSSSGGGVNRKN
uniref:GIN domain-containing protein n=1 Tax=Alistipes sp. TaxID=1872444 RepID=UPI004056D822